MNTVYRWYCEFNHGRSSLQEELQGRRKSVVFQKTFDAVRELIIQDCHLILRKIQIM